MDWVKVVNDILIGVVIPILASLLAGYIVLWVKRQGVAVDEERLRKRLEHILRDLVNAAEQRYGPGRGAEKKLYVKQGLVAAGFDPKDRLIDAALEAMVLREAPK